MACFVITPVATMQETLRITEIFYSLQGETRTAGLPTVFVRLTGCPLRCQYCDTAYAFSGGEIVTLDSILEQVAAYRPRYVCVTGGEPLAQPLAQLGGGGVGEGDDQQFPRLGPTCGQDVSQTGGQDAGLARTGAGENQNRPLGRLDRLALLRIQPLQIIARRLALGRTSAREVGNAGGGKISHRRKTIRQSESNRNIRGPRGNVRAAATMKPRNPADRRPVPRCDAAEH